MVETALFVLRDTLRSRWIIALSVFFFLLTEGCFRLSGDPDKASLLVSTATVLLVPLVSILLGSTYYYNSRDFVKLLLVQPQRRSTVYVGLFMGLSVAMILSFVVGVGVPSLLRFPTTFGQSSVWTLLVLSGSSLAVISVGVAFFIASVMVDKSKGITLSLVTWLGAAVIYDGLVLLTINLFREYPLEELILLLCFLNPLDLARVLLISKMDVSALMGVTGYVFNQFLTGGWGTIAALLSLLVWSLTPASIGLWRFRRLDF